MILQLKKTNLPLLMSPHLAHCVPLPAPGPPSTKITLGLPITALLKNICIMSKTFDATYGHVKVCPSLHF